MISLPRSVAAFGAIVFAFSCSGTDPDEGTHTGGASATGGAKASGGASAQTGGAGPGTGGTTATGGSKSGSGGASSGGSVSTGGASPMGGSQATGGSGPGNGGSKATGGASSTGGSGGKATTGGTSSTGGSGGKATTGGTSSTGGSGGKASTGGTSSTGGSGGGTGPVGASGYPAPGSGGVAKPSGTPNGITALPWAGFKGAVSYSFDDNTQSQIQNYSQLKALGVRFTFYLWTSRASFTDATWSSAKADGHELGNHTRNHPSNKGGDYQSDFDNGGKDIQSKYGVTAYTGASPNGWSEYANVANNFFIINRGVGGAAISFTDTSSNQYDLSGWLPSPGTANYDNVTSAVSGGKWLIVCIHGFTGDTSGAYNPVDFAGFSDSVKKVKSGGDAWIDTVSHIGAYWLGARAFAAATTSTAGSDKTWTWKLPAHFPPGNYLRVKVDGGTLKQNATTLAWDPHGYYEISLDALSVTLSP